MNDNTSDNETLWRLAACRMRRRYHSARRIIWVQATALALVIPLALWGWWR